MEAPIARLLKQYSDLSASNNVEDATASLSIYSAIHAVLQAVDQEEVVPNDHILFFEDILSGKKGIVPRTCQLLLVSIYAIIIRKAPGYVVRNILNSMVVICTNKASNPVGRDVAVSVIGIAIEHKFNHCGSQVNEVVQHLSRLLKSSETPSRIVVLSALSAIVNGSGSKIGDLHSEISKLAGKLVGDRAPEARQKAAVLVKSIARASAGCTTIQAETLIALCIKGLEDDVPAVQDAFCNALSEIFLEQIRAFWHNQEQAKLGLAREEDSTPKKQQMSIGARLSVSKLMATKKVIEEYDFKSVVNHVLKQIVKLTGAARAGYIGVLPHLINGCIEDIDNDEIEWLVISIVSLFQDPAFQGITYEEATYLRVRLSAVIRRNVTSRVSESKLVNLGTHLAKYCGGGADASHNDQVLQLALGELCNTIAVLGEASTCLATDVTQVATTHLRHSNFSVRTVSAQLLSCLSSVVPSIGADVLRSAHINITTQWKQVIIFDSVEVRERGEQQVLIGDDGQPMTAGPGPGGVSSGGSEDGRGDSGGGAVTAPTVAVVANAAAQKKRQGREAERLQRMFFLHGNTLVASMLLKAYNQGSLPYGLPQDVLSDMFDLGLELLKVDVQNAPAIQHIHCSILRAGSLIVASCLGMGFKIVRSRLSTLYTACQAIFDWTQANSGSEEGGGGDVMYEMMSVEAILACLCTLLRSCPEALTLDSQCMPFAVSGLECVFRALKSKYQTQHKAHFRFRTLHLLLLDCFACIPSDAYPATCQHVFVEALRVFRDALTNGAECSCLFDYVNEDFSVLRPRGLSCYKHGGICGPTALSSFTPSSALSLDMSLPEHFSMLKLEYIATALQKKESEAFLVVHSTGSGDTLLEPFPGSIQGVPTGQIEARSVDTAISLLGTIFNEQSVEYKDKALQLCTQAVAQFAKSSKSLSMFSSDEEKKRRDKKHYVTLKNVISLLSCIVSRLPHAGIGTGAGGLGGVGVGGGPAPPAWHKGFSSLLFDAVSHSSFPIRCSAASAVALFAARGTADQMGGGRDSVIAACIQIRALLMAAGKKKGEQMQDYAGYLLSLWAMWDLCEDATDVHPMILATVNDALRVPDRSLVYRAHGVYALACIVQSEAASLRQTITKTATVKSVGGEKSVNSGNVIIPPLLEVCAPRVELLESVMNTCRRGVATAETNVYQDTDNYLTCCMKLTTSAISLASELVVALAPAAAAAVTSSQMLGKAEKILQLLVTFWQTMCNTGQLMHNEALLVESAGVFPALSAVLSMPKAELVPDAADNSGEILRTKLMTCFFGHFRFVMTHRASFTFTALLKTIQALTPVLVNLPLVCCDAGIDNLLFELLDFCVGHTPVVGVAAFADLEFARGVMLSEAEGAHGNALGGGEVLMALISNIQHAIYSLVAADTRTHPDTRIVRWVLYCRMIALNLTQAGAGGVGAHTHGAGEDHHTGGAGAAGGSGSGGTSGASVSTGAGGGGEEDDGDGDDEDDDDFGGFSGASNAGGAGGDVASSTGDGASAAGPLLTYQRFVSVTRDRNNALPPYMQYARVQVKLTALKCVVLSVSALNEAGSHPAHFDLSLAREVTKAQLQQHGVGAAVDAANDVLDKVPQFLCLFLNDVINLSCACATYTIEDKAVHSLQSASLVVLHNVVSLYSDQIDPEVMLSSSETGSDVSSSSVENKLLLTSLSQILGAVRVCVQQPPAVSKELLLPAGLIAVRLIRSGFVTDKVVVRRLLKSLLPSLDESPPIITATKAKSDAAPVSEELDGDAAEAGTEHLEFRAPALEFVSESNACCVHIIKQAIAACLFELTSRGAAVSAVPAAVSAALKASLAPHMERIRSNWMAILIDSTKMRSSSSSSRDYLSGLGHNNNNDNSDCNNSDNGNTSVAMLGGLLYSPEAEVMEMTDTFSCCAPYVLLALSLAVAGSSSSSSSTDKKEAVAAPMMMFQGEPCAPIIFAAARRIVVDRCSSSTTSPPNTNNNNSIKHNTNKSNIINCEVQQLTYNMFYELSFAEKAEYSSRQNDTKSFIAMQSIVNLLQSSSNSISSVQWIRFIADVVEQQSQSSSSSSSSLLSTRTLALFASVVQAVVHKAVTSGSSSNISSNQQQEVKKQEQQQPLSLDIDSWSVLIRAVLFLWKVFLPELFAACSVEEEKEGPFWRVISPVELVIDMENRKDEGGDRPAAFFADRYLPCTLQTTSSAAAVPCVVSICISMALKDIVAVTSSVSPELSSQVALYATKLCAVAALSFGASAGAIEHARLQNQSQQPQEVSPSSYVSSSAVQSQHHLNLSKALTSRSGVRVAADEPSKSAAQTGQIMSAIFASSSGSSIGANVLLETLSAWLVDNTAHIPNVVSTAAEIVSAANSAIEKTITTTGSKAQMQQQQQQQQQQAQEKAAVAQAVSLRVSAMDALRVGALENALQLWCKACSTALATATRAPSSVPVPSAPSVAALGRCLSTVMSKTAVPMNSYRRYSIASAAACATVKLLQLNRLEPCAVYTANGLFPLLLSLFHNTSNPKSLPVQAADVSEHEHKVAMLCFVEYRLALLKILVLVYSSFLEDGDRDESKVQTKKGGFLSLSFAVICRSAVTALDALQKHPQPQGGPDHASPLLADGNTAYLRVTGQVLTMLARGSPEAFKAQVALLNDTVRASVQQIMLQAMQQQQQQQVAPQTSFGSSAASASPMKALNLSKFTSK